jgi:hypothetical protein
MHLKIYCTRFEPRSHETVRGAADLLFQLPNGSLLFTVKGFTLHEQNGKRWVQPPARGRNGRFYNMIEFPGAAERRTFREAAIAAIDRAVVDQTAMRNSQEQAA